MSARRFTVIFAACSGMPITSPFASAADRLRDPNHQNRQSPRTLGPLHEKVQL